MILTVLDHKLAFYQAARIGTYDCFSVTVPIDAVEIRLRFVITDSSERPTRHRDQFASHTALDEVKSNAEQNLAESKFLYGHYCNSSFGLA